jgi:hypothetical protein
VYAANPDGFHAPIAGQSGEFRDLGRVKIGPLLKSQSCGATEEFSPLRHRGPEKISKRKSVNDRIEIRLLVLASLGLGASVVKILAVFQPVARRHVTAHANHSEK